MPQAIKVLIVEDNPNDAELLVRALRDSGFEPAWLRVDTEADYLDRLQSGVDLVLSDYHLPQFSGPRALELLKKSGLDIPFILISGTIGEDTAVAAMRQGATDYLMKNRLTRLGQSITQALATCHLRAESRRTEQKLLVQDTALRAGEKRFREMAETIQDVFWSISCQDGLQVDYVSPAYENIWGRPVAALYARPDSWIDAIVEEDRQTVLAAQATLASGVEYRIEYRIIRPDGTVRWIEGRGYPVRNAAGKLERAVGVSTDITDRKQLTGQLLQAQKMEAIGQLAGGVAHDFNNSLTVITGYARLLLDDGGFPEDKAEQLRQIYAAGMRAGNLTRQLLLFSRKQAMHREAIDFNRHITELVKMLGRLIGEHIRVEVRLAPGLPAIEADAGMMEQILMNLSVNARDAMPQGGVLTLSTDLAVFDLLTVTRHPGRRAGRFIRLTVSDTGCGIQPENVARIFEPFYTTKPPGEGTGLGLATVFGIVQEHGGWVEVESAPAVGTRFRIYLPASANRSPAGQPSREAVAGRGSETILLVEDEPTVSEFIVAVLEHYGYRILRAKSGVDAPEVWHWHADRIALLLTDMVLPDGVSGPELAEKLQTERPGIKVVLMSGYTSEMVGQLSTRRPSTRFIQKPFQPNALAQIVREALDETATAVTPPEPALTS